MSELQRQRPKGVPHFHTDILAALEARRYRSLHQERIKLSDPRQLPQQVLWSWKAERWLHERLSRNRKHTLLDTAYHSLSEVRNASIRISMLLTLCHWGAISRASLFSARLQIIEERHWWKTAQSGSWTRMLPNLGKVTQDFPQRFSKAPLQDSLN